MQFTYELWVTVETDIYSFNYQYILSRYAAVLCGCETCTLPFSKKFQEAMIFMHFYQSNCVS